MELLTSVEQHFYIGTISQTYIISSRFHTDAHNILRLPNPEIFVPVIRMWPAFFFISK